MGGPGQLVQNTRQQADACRHLGSPLYGGLLDRIADDIATGGPCARVLAGHEGSRVRDAVPLRLMGAVHGLVLAGHAPGLARYYPSAGGTAPQRPEDAWPALREAVAGHPGRIRRWLARPPQTNEPGRANLLIAGVLHALGGEERPVRLLELGASAGLNLRADRFRCTAPGHAWGPAGSPVRLDGAWRGPVPGWLSEGAARHPALTVVERRGCDPDPVDPLSFQGALALRAYVWPDQTERAARLSGALRIAAGVPAVVERTGAADFLSAVRLEPGTLTVVWHSVMRQYVPDEEWRRVEAELERLAAAATKEAGFAHIAFEPRRVRPLRGFLLSVRRDAGETAYPAEAAPHGLPAWTPVPVR
ncbi:DUF2332 domain-containing protein [Streptomyces aidingensis]|uniref:DUF2332 domain-containing protein n=1 Tax=Streptomyces aidingensis TaxID=910347 RepID=A0A1I1P998_9ACTN|nr:DUF2332 domain-containing protein [Streptomyces aidingensis]SFD06407.1 hypothetical protein SAMN05421773_10950 [Streptomyces aidingensis]